MEDLTQFCLSSDRLRLQSISLDYQPSIFSEFTAEITEFMFPEPAATPRDTERFIKDALQQNKRGTDLTIVILKLPDLEFLGVCGVHRIHTDTPEIGIWLKQSAHGHGYGREAVHCLKHWLDQTLDYDYLVYTVDQNNIPSRKIPESLGGKIVRNYEKLSLSGKMLNLLEYWIYKL
jgi:RimJ/RimL family protein N-acetyltransferase